MQLNVTQKIFLVTATAGLALATLGVVVFGTFKQVVISSDKLTELNAALKNHQAADMMHDAVRGDVISFRLAQVTGDTALAEAAQSELADHGQELRDRITANEQLALPAEVDALIRPTRAPLEHYLQAGQDLMALSSSDGARLDQAMQTFLNAFDELEDAMAAVSDQLVETMQETQLASANLVAGFKRTLLAGLGLSAIALTLVSLLVARSVPRPFAAIIAELSRTSSLNTDAARVVANSSAELADAANTQAASLEQVSASLEEVAGMTARNTQHAERAKTLSGAARDGVEVGTSQMERMEAAMDAIKKASEEIAAILKTIDEIAFQTNILALNAAVEAARAGEAGAGFAVVADEVRALAQRSAKAASEVEDKISDAIQRTGAGVSICAEVSANLGSIAQQVREVDDLMREISSASEEQAQNTQQVNSAVSQMDQIVQSSAAQAQESSSTAHDLSEQANSLESIVERLAALVGRQSAQAPAPADLPPAAIATKVRPRSSASLVRA